MGEIASLVDKIDENWHGEQSRWDGREIMDVQAQSLLIGALSEATGQARGGEVVVKRGLYFMFACKPHVRHQDIIVDLAWR